MKIVFHAYDVVFAGIFADLDFHNHEGEFAFVLQAVDFAHRDVGGFVGAYVEDFLADCHCGGSAHHDPVLGAVQVLLQAQALAGLHHNALHLVVVGVLEHGVRAPRAVHCLRNAHEVGSATLEFFHDLLHFLAAAERSHEECVGGVHDEHLVEVNGGDGAL